MLRRSLFRLTVFVAGLGLVVSSLAAFGQETSRRGRKYKAPPPTSRIEITILRGVDGKPVENAAVIFHLIGDKGNMELKTGEDGKTMIDVLPTGSSVLLQVVAKGFQTYGADYKIDKAQMAIEVKLNRPGQQYSIYKASEGAKAGKVPDAGKSSDTGKPADANKDAAPKDAAPKDAAPKDAAPKDAAKDKPAESAQQNDAKPDASQPQPQ